MTLVIAGMTQLCSADDIEQFVAKLKTAEINAETLFSGLRYSATVSVQRPNSGDEVFEFEFDQLRPDLWRLDIRRAGSGSLVRDGDFWFSVTEQSEGNGKRYDRLGFDDAAIASIGGSLQSQNTLLASATHLLDIPLSRFVSLPEVQWEAVETPVRPESHHRLRWTLKPESKGTYLPAFGAIEWVLDENHALLTRYEYYFGRPGKNDPKGIVVDVAYDRHDGRLLPSRSLRLEGGVKTETIRGKTTAAITDLEYYRPAAFGLARPAKPWQRYQVWGLLGLGAAAIGISLRWWRTRTIHYGN